MGSSNIVVFIHRGADEMRESLLLAPEVAARLGWSNGKVISERQALEAQFLNAMHGLSQCVERRKQEEGK